MRIARACARGRRYRNDGHMAVSSGAVPCATLLRRLWEYAGRCRRVSYRFSWEDQAPALLAGHFLLLRLLEWVWLDWLLLLAHLPLLLRVHERGLAGASRWTQAPFLEVLLGVLGPMLELRAHMLSHIAVCSVAPIGGAKS